MTQYIVPPRGQVPASLAERGATVPFQTSALVATRARADDRAGIAAVVPNFSGTGTQFIIPWVDLPLSFVLNTADLALHRAIAQDQAVTPELIEAAVRRVAESGGAGPKAQAEVRRARELEMGREIRLQTILMVHLARTNAGSGPLADDIRAALRHLRRRFPVSPPLQGGAGESVLDRVGQLARELLPVGLPEYGDLRLAGRIRALLGDIDNMRRHLARRAGDMPELAALAMRFDRCGHDTLRAARQSLNRIDHWLLDLPAQMLAWPNSLIPLREEVHRLSWLLDGWEQAIACYATCVAEWLTPARERHLTRLGALAPLLPAHEVVAAALRDVQRAPELGPLLLDARRAALQLREAGEERQTK